MNSGPVRDNAAHAAAAPSEAPLLKLEDFLPHRLNVLSSLVSQALTRVYGRYGIGIPEWRVRVSLRGDGRYSGPAGGERGPIPITQNAPASARAPETELLIPAAQRGPIRVQVPCRSACR